MRVKMITRLAGPGLNAQPGEVVEVTEEMGHGLLVSGQATPVADIEKATAPPPPETAAVVDKAPAPKPESKPPPPKLDDGPTLPDDHDPMLDELGITGQPAEALVDADILMLSDILARGDLTKVKGIGKASAATIAKAVKAWRS